MSWFRRKSSKKRGRFRRPEFQEKLSQARGYSRSAKPLPENRKDAIVTTLKLNSLLVRFLILVVIVAAIYFLTISDYFLVKEVQSPAGDAELISSTMARLGRERKYLIPKTHILLLGQNLLLKELQADHPQVQSIATFEKHFPNKLELSLEIRQATAILHSGEVYYVLGQDARVISVVLPEALASVNLPIIEERNGLPLKPGDDAGISPALGFVDTLNRNEQEARFGFRFAQFELPSRKSPDFIAITSLGFEVLFDLQRPIEVQLDNLALVLNQEIDYDRRPELVYVDLRLAETAYYCYKEEECDPKVIEEMKQALEESQPEE